MKRKTADDEYEEIMQGAMDRFDRVRAPLAEYVLNLRAFRERVAERLSLAEADLRREEGR